MQGEGAGPAPVPAASLGVLSLLALLPGATAASALRRAALRRPAH